MIITLKSLSTLSRLNRCFIHVGTIYEGQHDVISSFLLISLLQPLFRRHTSVTVAHGCCTRHGLTERGRRHWIGLMRTCERTSCPTHPSMSTSSHSSNASA